MLITTTPSSALLSLFPPPPPPYSLLKFTTATTPPFNSVNASFTPRPLLLPLSQRRRRKYWRVVALVDSSDVVRNFYGGVNAHDLDSVEDLIALNCVYEDLVFPSPFVGRKDIIDFFKKFTSSTTKDLQFVIDDLSTQDPSSVGVIWHLEWKGKPFPFSKGCSFYRLEVIDGKRQITYGRDSVEPAVKPGDATLAIIRSVTWLLQQFPQLADRL